jgi:hypothetical protein
MGEVEYNTVVMMMGMYGGLLKEIEKQYGFEKALQMHGAMGFPMGVSSGEAMKKAAGAKKPSLKIVESVNNEMMSGFGATFKVTEKGNSIKYEISRCPMYDGFKASGFSHEEVQKFCESMAPQEYNGIKSIVPNVVGSFKVKGSPDGRCVEEFEVR